MTETVARRRKPKPAPAKYTKPEPMPAAQFAAWCDEAEARLGLKTVTEIGNALGLARRTVTKYRSEGAPAPIRLAIAALEARLQPWAQPQQSL